MNRTRLPDLRAEDGIAIVVAVLLMSIMLMIGLGAMSFVDGQSKLTAKQRQRETSFNISEAALNAQITQISHHWPGKNGQTDATVAFSACPGGTYCPSGGELTSLVPGADSTVPVTWKTNVYDNDTNLSGFFADSRVVGNPCGCDANGDGKMWVRAQATVRGKTRVVVSLVQQQMQAESVPHAAIIAGALTITNNGNHGQPIIDANGGLVGVRCQHPPDAGSGGTPESSSAPCMGQPLGVAPTKTDAAWSDLLTQQIDGFATRQEGYSPAPAFTQDQIDRFVATAKAQSTYYTGCPSTLAGPVVVINTTGTCSYTGNNQWNTKADPGFLLLLNANSALSLNGGVNYYGVIYHENAATPPLLGSTPQSTATLISVHGNAKVIGGVIIDGMGRMEVGSSGSQDSNIEFDDHGYDAVQSYAGAGIIQNSWREIQPGQ